MTPLARRRLAAALAVACAVVYLWMLFAWETAWGVDLKHRDSPPWLVGHGDGPAATTPQLSLR